MPEIGEQPQAIERGDWSALRKRGRVSMAAQAVVSPVPIDARVGRPPGPEHLSGHAKELCQKLTFSRRPGWFSGSEDLLAAYVSIAYSAR
jgi:hypothetical protein